MGSGGGRECRTCSLKAGLSEPKKGSSQKVSDSKEDLNNYGCGGQGYDRKKESNELLRGSLKGKVCPFSPAFKKKGTVDKRERS